jgi:hypothetical protein
MNVRFAAAAAALLVSAAITAPIPAAGASAAVAPPGEITTEVGGSWIQWANCVFISFDPTTGDFRCVGGSTWEGAWTGITHYDVTGNIDPTTGDMRGAFTEIFTGTALDDKSTGTLTFRETFTIRGATQALHIEADIVGGDGAPTWRCSSGHVTFDGLDPLVTGIGGYHGSWSHGCR